MTPSLEEPETLLKQINGQTITFSYVISKIGIRTRILNLEKNAIFDLMFYGINGEIVKTETMILTTEEYNIWGADDNYILNLISQKYNVVFQ